MLDYTGIECPVCKSPFQADDDIVVCPECGAPYHRECYQKEGRCVFEDLHAQGGEWSPPVSETKPDKSGPDVSAEIKDRECPVCGVLNFHSAQLCSHCGAPLSGETRAPVNPPPYVSYGNTASPFSFDPMGGVSPADILDDQVTYGEASKLVKQNTGYYMPVFRYMKQTGRNKFNFSAFLFSGAWMLYRKQYKYGAVVTALMFCLHIAYFCVTAFISSPALLGLMEQVDMDISQGFSPTNEQMLAITNLVMEDPLLYFKICLPLLCLLFMLIVMIVVGVRGNKMYMRHCVRMVRRVKSEKKDGDTGLALETKGGVNYPIAVCMFICYLIVTYSPILL